jgi:hypothetical protein
MFRSRKKDSSTDKKRETLVYGYSWLRYPMIIALIFQGFYLSHFPDIGIAYIACTLIFMGLYFVFKHARKIKHDEENLYLIRAKKEITVPFINVISIKKSRSKVNSSRFWKLKYVNDLGETKTIRFFSDFNKEFHRLIRKENPKVVIWTHPHFRN